MKNTEPVVVQQTFHRPPADVWKAITDANLMKQWFFENMEEFVPEKDFETQFNVVSNNRDFLHLWKLTEVVPLKRIVYNWKYKGYDGNSYVSFELFDHKEGTLLKLTHTVTKNFPQDIEEFRRESCVAGWEYFIQNRLKSFLTKSLPLPD